MFYQAKVFVKHSISKLDPKTISQEKKQFQKRKEDQKELN